MLQHDNESGELDPLLEFSDESSAVPTRGASASASAPLQPVTQVTSAPTAPTLVDPVSSTETLTMRVDRLERNLAKTTGQIASLKSEVATLVGTMNDMKKRDGRGDARQPHPSVTPANTRSLWRFFAASPSKR